MADFVFGALVRITAPVPESLHGETGRLILADATQAVVAVTGHHLFAFDRADVVVLEPPDGTVIGTGASATTKTVLLFDGATNKYPPRPNVNSVEWIGPASSDPADPANITDGVSAAQDNDTWIKT